ncbi:class II peroxidase [Periconia macrospinosa]|uniref:Peroxidase n=1 Tax=Periconia macrospinosa TaxID=97972 RepID=A0A2V1E4R5_9PLEO|nr:class II peroxidase [Periconia macrospinosa]
MVEVTGPTTRFGISIVEARGSPSSSCPSVWNEISSELTTLFLSDGQCNDDARAAIRLNFHDCGAWEKSLGATAGCDGSIVLNAEENARTENRGLQAISIKIKNLATKYKVGVADMIVFAGSHATATCPGGPKIRTWIGRKDSTTAAPNNLLPNPFASADSLYALFQAKGFDDVDLAALIGAHTASRQLFVDPSKAGQPQDSTPGVWDVKYYSQTRSPPDGVFVLPSDAKLAAHPVVGKQFAGFVNGQGKWTGKYAEAMGRMNLHGLAGTDGLADCTGALPRSTSIKREMRGMAINERVV